MRYITGVNPDGKSAVVAADEPRRTWTWSASSAQAPHFVHRALNPEFGSQRPPAESASTNELWTVRQGIDAVTGEDPETYTYEPGEFSLDVPAGMLRWCITRFGPGYASKIHHTDSIDLDMCIDGDLTLVLETEEIHLRPGDAVVLPMLEHAWRTETGGAIAYCMISPHALGAAGGYQASVASSGQNVAM